jgi:hypothetical protein
MANAITYCRTTRNPLRLRQQKGEHVMKIVTMDEAQTQLPVLLAAVEATGESVLIP